MEMIEAVKERNQSEALKGHNCQGEPRSPAERKP